MIAHEIQNTDAIFALTTVLSTGICDPDEVGMPSKSDPPVLEDGFAGAEKIPPQAGPEAFGPERQIAEHAVGLRMSNVVTRARRDGGHHGRRLGILRRLRRWPRRTR